MVSLHTILISVLLLGLGCATPLAKRGAVKKFVVDVNERGTRFVEEVIIDKGRNVEIFSVPQHNNIDESHLYVDLNKGLLVHRFPKTNACFLRTAGDDFPAVGDLETGLKMEHHLKSEDKVMPDENIVHHYRIVGNNIVDRSFLGREMAQFCKGAQMFWTQELEEVISVHEEPNPTPPAPRNETIVPGLGRVPNRQRRFIPPSCASPRVKSACVIIENHCHYFRVCQRVYNGVLRAFETVCKTNHNYGTSSCCVECCLDGKDAIFPACSQFNSEQDVKDYAKDEGKCPNA